MSRRMKVGLPTLAQGRLMLPDPPAQGRLIAESNRVNLLPMNLRSTNKTDLVLKSKKEKTRSELFEQF